VRDWIAAEREFLAWKTGLEAARRAWQGTPDSSKDDALLMGVALAQARSWLGKRREDLPVVDRNFIDQSTRRESKVRARARRAQALIYVLLVGIILGLIGLINRTYIEEAVNWYWTMQPYMVAQVRPYVLSPDAERALKPGQAFRECAKDCPEMVVVPAGEFMMGSPPTEKHRMPDEDPQHRVTIARPFAVSKYDVTFNDWDACVSVGGCPREGRAGDVDWGTRHTPRHLCELGRCPAVCGLALSDDRQALPAALRRRVRIRGARGDADGLSVGQRHRQEQRQLRRLRQPVERVGRYLANGTSRFIRRQSVRSS
jgi:formylglycine-generating enzyme required for sulfatase activity